MDIDEQQEWDDRDAAIFQHQMYERRRRETEAFSSMERGRREFQRQIDEWLSDFSTYTPKISRDKTCQK